MPRQQLAKDARIELERLQAFEAGEREINASGLAKIAQVLEVSVEDLLANSGSHDPEPFVTMCSRPAGAEVITLLGGEFAMKEASSVLAAG